MDAYSAEYLLWIQRPSVTCLLWANTIMIHTHILPRLWPNYHLYGSETWVWSQAMVQTLRGFHNRVVRRLSGRMPRRQNGKWVYPPIEEAYEITGVSSMDVYIARRRETFASKIARRPILTLCRQSERLPGTPTGTRFWWEQRLDVDNPNFIVNGT